MECLIVQDFLALSIIPTTATPTTATAILVVRQLDTYIVPGNVGYFDMLWQWHHFSVCLRVHVCVRG